MQRPAGAGAAGKVRGWCRIGMRGDRRRDDTVTDANYAFLLSRTGIGMIAGYQIYPVAELADVAQAFQEGATFRESIG